jgi:hypothetical protein
MFQYDNASELAARTMSGLRELGYLDNADVPLCYRSPLRFATVLLFGLLPFSSSVCFCKVTANLCRGVLYVKMQNNQF